MKNKQKGITLVALIVTIIILLILAGVSIATLTESGLFEKTRQAEQKSENAQIKEETTLGEYENTIQEYITGHREDIKLEIEDKSEGIQFNTTYIDASQSSVEVKQYGKMVFLGFILKLKVNIPNADLEIFNGVPKPVSNVYFVGRDSADNSTTFAIGLNSNKVRTYWSGDFQNTIIGSCMYLTEE